MMKFVVSSDILHFDIRYRKLEMFVTMQLRVSVERLKGHYPQ